MAVTPKQPKKSARHRQSMRFDVAGDERGVTLIASRDEECAAQVVDFSRGGMRVCFSAGPQLTVEQDVLIADDQTVSVCTVRNISDSEAGPITVGLQICHTFPIAKLPEKKRAQWTYKDDIAPRQSSSMLWMAVLFLIGIGTPIALLNFNAARTYVSNWAAQPLWQATPKKVAATEKSAATPDNSQRQSETDSTGRQQTSSDASQRTQRSPRRSSAATGNSRRPASRPRGRSAFTADDALPQF